MSIRLRLTLLYSAILALTLVLFGVTLYLVTRELTIGAVEEDLKNESTALLNGARRGWFNSIELPASKVAAKDTYVQVRQADGSEMPGTIFRDRTDNLFGADIPLSDEAVQRVRRSGPLLERTTINGKRVLVQVTPVYRRGDRGAFVGILQTARPIGEQEQALDVLSKLLTFGTVIATLLAFGIGWGLAGAALRPINRITQTARAIGAERDFGRRVRYDGPPDEIGRLATTFNGMLGQLGLAYSQVEQALRAQRRFVADASHELRTPLTSIRGNLALLGRRPPISEEDRAAVLADTEEESERLIRLVNDLLVLARADAGRPLKREPVPVGELVDDVCRQARGLAGDRTVACADAGSLIAVGDRDALKQVLLILVDNAVKFAPPGGHVGIEVAEREGCVAIAVRDDGPGIDPDALSHIFERFYQGDASRAGIGTGLGLAIAKQLVEAQSGAIAVESEPGRGSTFTVSLPATAMAAVVAGDAAKAVPDAVGEVRGRVV